MIILSNQGLAGLNDRANILFHVTNLAIFLCAVVYVLKPCEMLNVRHNVDNLRKAKKLDCELRWDDFFEIQDFNGNDVLMVDDNSGFINDKRTILKRSNITNMYHRASTSKTNWIWKIDTIWFRFWLETERSLSKTYGKHNYPSFKGASRASTSGCFYPMEFSDPIKKVFLEFLKSTNLKQFEYITLHIRRGDAKKLCNTSIEKMNNYITCSLANCNADNFGFNQTIIVFTDELNSEYLDDVEKILEEKGHRFLNGEAKVLELVLEMVVGNEFHDENAGNSTKKSVTKYLNNYFTFQASNIIKFYARYKLVQRKRGQCHDCDEAC